MPPATCGICSTLQPRELLELDSLLADPLSWPSSLWGIFPVPVGGLPASYRRWGGEKMAREWLDRHGREDISRTTIRRHFRYDVAHIARSVEEMVDIGLIAETPAAKLPVDPRLDPLAFMRYFNAGILVGEAALKMLVERVNAMDPKDVPLGTLLELMSQAEKLAKTQAALQQKGLKFGQGPDEDDAFRGSKDTLPTRIGHTSIRDVDGERTSIHDEGAADRAEHNERAKIEGGPQLN